MSALVSVIIPVYNGAAHLRECLDCFAAQTYGDIEIVCVDDGSTDESPAILAEFAAAHGNVRIVRQENQGAGAARNRGLDEARGDYILFFDCDDTCDARLVEECVRAAEETQADFVWVPFLIFDERIGAPLLLDGDFPQHHFPKVFSWRDNPDWTFRSLHNYPWNKLFRASFVAEHGIRFVDLRLTEDLTFAAPAAVFAQRIVSLEEPLVTHRQGQPGSLMSNKDDHPLDFLHAFRWLRSFLQDNGVYEPLEAAYANWAASGCVYNLETLRTYDAFERVYRTLASDDGLRALGLLDVDPAVYQEDRWREFVACVQREEPAAYAFRRFSAELEGNEVLQLREASVEKRHRAEIEAFQEHCDMLRAAHDEACAQRDALQAELDALRNAAEQKVGRAICAIPRAVQRAMRGRADG